MYNFQAQKTRIYVPFLSNPDLVGLWPFPEFNRSLRKDFILDRLKSEMRNIEFIDGDFIQDLGELEKVAERNDIDGILTYTLNQTLFPKAPWCFREKADVSIFKKHPMIITGGLFAGTHQLLDFNEVVKRKKLPVLPVASFTFEDGLKDVKLALHLIEVIRNVKRSKILYVGPLERMPNPAQANFWRRDPEQYLETLKKVFGVEVIHMSAEELNKLYENVDENSAEEVARKWVDGAMSVDGPNKGEIGKSARLYLAMKKAMKDTGANVISVNGRWALDFRDWLHVLGEERKEIVADNKFIPKGALKILPCMANSQLMDEKDVSIGPEGDLDAAVTNLIGQNLTGKHGWVYEPDISFSAGQLIYFHCCIPRKLWGPDGPSQPYELRYSCGRCGVAPEIQLPLNEIVTSVKISVTDKKLAIHSGRIVGSICKEDRYHGMKMGRGEITIGEQSCINKVIVEANAKKIFENYNYGTFGWHRSAFLGDFREQILNLATLLRLEVIEEDRD